MSLISSIQFHYRRWSAVRAAEKLLPRATTNERGNIQALQRAFRVLPRVPTTGVPQNEADWNSAMNRLRELGASADPRAFQRWDVIIARMAHIGSSATPIELAALKDDPEWDTRWRGAIQEVSTGLPIRYSNYPDSSEVLIQTAYHTREFERLTGKRVSEWDTIVEFGGGFGGLCRLIHVLGFKGRYVVLDLEPFTLLQRYYLISVGVLPSASITLTSDLAALESIANEKNAVLWATWSLSETPLELRTRVAPIAERIGNYCVAFQGRYGDVDNVSYFTNAWPGTKTIERIEHRPDDYYMTGSTQ